MTARAREHEAQCTFLPVAHSFIHPGEPPPRKHAVCWPERHPTLTTTWSPRDSDAAANHQLSLHQISSKAITRAPSEFRLIGSDITSQTFLLCSCLNSSLNHAYSLPSAFILSFLFPFQASSPWSLDLPEHVAPHSVSNLRLPCAAYIGAWRHWIGNPSRRKCKGSTQLRLQHVTSRAQPAQRLSTTLPSAHSYLPALHSLKY